MTMDKHIDALVLIIYSLLNKDLLFLYGWLNAIHVYYSQTVVGGLWLGHDIYLDLINVVIPHYDDAGRLSLFARFVSRMPQTS